MTLLTDMTDDLDVFFDTDDLATAASYRAKGTIIDVALDVLFIEDTAADVSRQRSGLEYYSRMGRLICKKSDVSAPKAGDSFTIGTDTWIMQDLDGASPVVWAINVHTAAQAGKVGP